MVTFINSDNKPVALFKAWTVRTYYILKRNGLNPMTAEDCIRIGNAIRFNEVRNAGMLMAIELYRGAGLGVYTIYHLFHGEISLERIKTECNFFDKLHNQSI